MSKKDLFLKFRSSVPTFSQVNYYVEFNSPSISLAFIKIGILKKSEHHLLCFYLQASEREQREELAIFEHISNSAVRNPLQQPLNQDAS